MKRRDQLPQVQDALVDLVKGEVRWAAGDLRARIPSCAILLLCDPTKRGMLPPRRWAGGLNFLLKDVSGAVLADSVRRLAAGERVVSPLLQAASLNTDRGLSTRELEVLGLAAEDNLAGRESLHIAQLLAERML